MIKIAIEARALAMQGGGVKRYTRELIRALPNENRQAQWAVVTADLPSPTFTLCQTISIPIRHEAEILFNTWLSYRVQSGLIKFAPNLVHYTKAAIPRKPLYPAVVTIHDVIPILYPASQHPAARWYWPHTLRHAAKASAHIITISQASKADIVRYLNVDPEKISVTPLAVNRDYFHPQSEQIIETAIKELNIAAPYILFLATRDMRKNISALLQAFAKLSSEIPHTLVIAGHSALKRDNSRQLAETLGITERVKFLDFVPEEFLPALYGGADLFVWPSVYEGWAFPVLEAMACGTPVIVSNGGALPEAVGEAGEIVPFTVETIGDRFQDSYFINALAERMRVVLSSLEKRADMRKKGLAQAARFSWEDVALKTWAVYKKLL